MLSFRCESGEVFSRYACNLYETRQNGAKYHLNEDFIIMKKQFTLDKANVKLARQIEATKSTLNKYIKRERNKTLPEGKDFWDFACKFGADSTEAKAVHLKELNEYLDEAEKNEQSSFYVEIVAKAKARQRRS